MTIWHPVYHLSTGAGWPISPRDIRRSSPRIAEVRGSGISIADATDADLVDAFVQGRDPLDPGQLMRSAQLLAVFGLLGVEPPMDGQLEEVAALGSNLSAEDLYAAIVDLADRGVAQRRGRTVVFQPRPIALNLAASAMETMASGNLGSGCWPVTPALVSRCWLPDNWPFSTPLTSHETC